MPLKGIGKPNLGKVKSGFKLLPQKVTRGSQMQKPFVRGDIGTNHPITTVYARKKKPKMY